MPDIVMHHHFGKVVYTALETKVKKHIDNLAVYDFATAGPDPFYFYHFLNHKKQKDSQNFGDYMHRYKTKEFFLKLIEIAKVDYYVFNYLCGFITHYYLDSIVHPYIFFNTGIYDINDEDTLQYRGLHTRLERAMDCYIIENYYDKKSNKFRINRQILKLKKLDKRSKVSFDRLYADIYGKNNGYKYLNASITWQKRFYKTLYDPYGLINYFLTKKDDGKSELDLKVLSYYNRNIPQEQIDIFNFKHQPWCNPVDKDTQFTDSFFDLFEKAKEIAISCINDLSAYVFDNESFDFDYYFKDISYITGYPSSYNLEMKYFFNIFGKNND